MFVGTCIYLYVNTQLNTYLSVIAVCKLSFSLSLVAVYMLLFLFGWGFFVGFFLLLSFVLGKKNPNILPVLVNSQR